MCCTCPVIQNYNVSALNKQVISEIMKYKWIESEKVGYDIGFEKAAKEWIDRYYDDFLKAFLEDY